MIQSLDPVRVDVATAVFDEVVDFIDNEKKSIELIAQVMPKRVEKSIKEPTFAELQVQRMKKAHSEAESNLKKTENALLKKI